MNKFLFLMSTGTKTALIERKLKNSLLSHTKNISLYIIAIAAS